MLAYRSEIFGYGFRRFALRMVEVRVTVDCMAVLVEELGSRVRIGTLKGQLAER